ncbi:MAG: acyl-CoA dehydrogenase family protein [Acidimicrobiia bacterium]
MRSWLAEHPDPDGRELAEAGYVAPHWPEPWGLGADVEARLIIDEELDRAGVRMPNNPIGIGWAGPTIVAAGTEAQQRRWLPSILDGSTFWCQLFSEPDAGSDLAALRTRAERDGDEYVVTGQKIWSTWANHSDWGILLARTDPGAAKHRGISYFVVDMASPGIEVREIIEMTGGNHFNETFFTDVRIPVENRIGDENDGWRLARLTLGNERLSLSEGGVLWGMGPTSAEFLALVRNSGGLRGDEARQRAVAAYEEMTVLRLLGYRILTKMMHGGDAGVDASIRKLLADLHGQHVMDLVKDLRGPSGMLGAYGEDQTADEWHWGFLFAPALTIGGGTTEVQRNIIAERLLGLPREKTG